MVSLGDVWVVGVVWRPYKGLVPASTAQHGQNEGIRRLDRVTENVSEQLKMAY